MIYNVNDINFTNSNLYQEFLKENPKTGYLKIRAYAASGAIPITNLKVIVSKNIENDKIIFFEGLTNSSGIIENITLPAPSLNESDLVKPNNITYDIEATYESGSKYTYQVYIYENVYVIQNINIVPNIKGDL